MSLSLRHFGESNSFPKSLENYTSARDDLRFFPRSYDKGIK